MINFYKLLSFWKKKGILKEQLSQFAAIAIANYSCRKKRRKNGYNFLARGLLNKTKVSRKVSQLQSPSQYMNDVHLSE